MIHQSRQHLQTLRHAHLHEAPDPRTLPPSRGCRPFGLGHVQLTIGARAALATSRESYQQYLNRHASGHWTETPLDEREENHAAIVEGRGIFTQHTLKNGIRIWIATESDRSLTTVFLPSEDLPEQEESAAREALRARRVVSQREQCERAARTTMIALLLGNPRVREVRPLDKECRGEHAA